MDKLLKQLPVCNKCKIDNGSFSPYLLVFNLLKQLFRIWWYFYSMSKMKCTFDTIL